MRAIEVAEPGGPDVLRLVEVDVPEPLPTEVRVRVHAAGVNPVDWKTRSGAGVAAIIGPPPFRVGWDVSGVVDAVGAGVTRFMVGDEVFGMPWFPRQAGAYADYVTAPSRQFALKPGQIDHIEAAGLPLAGLTAWQALVETAELRAGQRVLILGVAGGVGHIALQIAKSRGCQVIGTARAEKHDFLAQIGLDEAIDYTTSSVAEIEEPVDVVLDLIGGESGKEALERVRPGGYFIPVPSRDAELAEIARARGLKGRNLLVEPDGHALEELAALVRFGALRVETDSIFPLAEAAEAHRRSEFGRARGKIILRVAD